MLLKILNEIKNNNEIKIIKFKKGIPISLNDDNRICNFTSNPQKKKNKIIFNNVLNFFNNNKNNLITVNQLEDNNNLIVQKAKKIMSYNDKELNSLTYKLAVRFDKRSYCEYYLSLIKTKHNLIFSFYSKDYNSKIVKIDLFFISFIVNYTINTLFFDDSTMHKIYKGKGDFPFLYQLPKIIYSSIISSILNILLKLLALSEDNILEFKKNRKIYGLNERAIELNKKLKLKFLLFFIVSSIFLVIFWYYVAIFCAIYINTQIHLLKDSLISFGLSLLYPLAIYLLPGIFRIPALSDKNEKSEYIYSIGKLLQML